MNEYTDFLKDLLKAKLLKKLDKAEQNEKLTANNIKECKKQFFNLRNLRNEFFLKLDVFLEYKQKVLKRRRSSFSSRKSLGSVKNKPFDPLTSQASYKNNFEKKKTLDIRKRSRSRGSIVVH